MSIFKDPNMGGVGIGTQTPPATLDDRQSAAARRPSLHLETNAVYGGGADRRPSHAIVDIALTARSRQRRSDRGPTLYREQHTLSSMQTTPQHKLSVATEQAGMPITFETNGSERMRIDRTGPGIGTNMPQGALHILTAGEPPAGLDQPQTGLLLGAQGTAGFKRLQSYGEPLSLNPKGNGVGIGTTTPQATLDVAGAIAVGGVSVINEQEQWIGDPANLLGPAGPRRPRRPRWCSRHDIAITSGREHLTRRWHDQATRSYRLLNSGPRI
jgi:hypothetical protein